MPLVQVNIDPSSPTLTLRLEDTLDQPNITLAAAPAGLAACVGASAGGPAACTGGHTFVEAPNVTDSLAMSHLLLEVSPL